MREYARFFRDYLTGCEQSFVVDTGLRSECADAAGTGVVTLANADILAGRKFDDGIARSPWPSSCTRARSRVWNGCSKIATKYPSGVLFRYVRAAYLQPDAASLHNTKQSRRPA